MEHHAEKDEIEGPPVDELPPFISIPLCQAGIDGHGSIDSTFRGNEAHWD